MDDKRIMNNRMEIDKILSDRLLNDLIGEIRNLLDVLPNIQDPVQYGFIEMKLRSLDKVLQEHIDNARAVRFQLL